MGWRDLFYFSRGERHALILLTLLIAGGWGALLWTDHAATGEPSPASEATADTTGVKPPQRTEERPVAPLQAERAPIERRVKAYRYPARESNKFPEGTVVDLNRADSLTLQRVPGIGPTFARRIVKYRELLGGFREVGQLQEVYGITPERYAALSPWFRADTSLLVRRDLNQLSFKEMLRHPYIDYGQARALSNLIRRKGRVNNWDEVRLLDEFPETAIHKLDAYFGFSPR